MDITKTILPIVLRGIATIIENSDNPKNPEKNNKSKKKTCHFNKKGKCKNGDTCRFSHDL